MKVFSNVIFENFCLRRIPVEIKNESNKYVFETYEYLLENLEGLITSYKNKLDLKVNSFNSGTCAERLKMEAEIEKCKAWEEKIKSFSHSIFEDECFNKIKSNFLIYLMRRFLAF